MNTTNEIAMAWRRVPSIKHCRDAVLEDDNIQSFLAWSRSCGRAAPAGAVRYLADKVPIVRWLPNYNPSWLVNDTVAGLTVGVLLVPQSLAYANIAKVPGAYGLLSSWLPMMVYTIMGTSKDIQTAPVAIGALLTGAIVTNLLGEGYSAPEIAAAVTFMVGIYSAILGVFKLGFLLDFVSAPVLAGFVSAAGLTICLQQVPNLVGLGDVGRETTQIIDAVFTSLPSIKWRDFVIGSTSLLALWAFQQVGARWGKSSRYVRFIVIARNAIIIILYTGISYAVNKDTPDHPVFGISKTVGATIAPPSVPSGKLMAQVSGGAITVIVAAALEHLAIGKAFGRRHGYVIDQSQELLFVGVANICGGFFSAIPVTGGFSRTAVNSESGVKSPLGGLVTSGCVLLSIYKLSGAFFWIPKATLAAIIISAVWAIIVPPRLFFRFWKTSFVDFVASMISFWVTLFVSVEIAIASAVGFNLLYLLFRLAFTGATHVGGPLARDTHVDLPEGATKLEPESEATQWFRLGDSVMFSNAYRVKDDIITRVKTVTKGVPLPAVSEADRLWIQRRRGGGSEDVDRAALDDRPLLRQVVLDMTAVNHIDTTGMQALADLKEELRLYAGHSSVVFVGMNDTVKRRFRRAKWSLHKASGLHVASRDLVSDFLGGGDWTILRGESKDGLSKIDMGEVKHVDEITSDKW